MSVMLPFNQISIEGTPIAEPADFAYGAGKYSKAGADSAVTTADGRIHNFRSAQSIEASCELLGDMTAHDTGYPGTAAPWPTLPVTVLLERMKTAGDESPDEISEFEGILSMDYDSQSNKTSVTIKGIV